MNRPWTLWLALSLLQAACDGGEEGSNPSGSPGGNTPASADSATGLALGTFCVKVAVDSERCETTNNRVLRKVSDGNIKIEVQHGTTFGCTYGEMGNFEVVAVVPDGVPLPYKNVTGVTLDVSRLATKCWYTSYVAVPTSSAIYQTGTGGSTRVEGDLSFTAIAATQQCDGDPEASCPGTSDIRLRFNLPL